MTEAWEWKGRGGSGEGTPGSRLPEATSFMARVRSHFVLQAVRRDPSCYFSSQRPVRGGEAGSSGSHGQRVVRPPNLCSQPWLPTLSPEDETLESDARLGPVQPRRWLLSHPGFQSCSLSAKTLVRSPGAGGEGQEILDAHGKPF